MRVRILHFLWLLRKGGGAPRLFDALDGSLQEKLEQVRRGEDTGAGTDPA